jgi:hypothetical protein
MGIPISLAIIALAALIHASFQLSVSVLTLLSAHTIGAKRSRARLLCLTTSFVLGAGLMTLLLLSFISLVLIHLFGSNVPHIVWLVVCSLLIVIAIAIWSFYYRRGKGTMLWIPRGMARYLISRTESTKLCAESFGLGLSSVIGEILFIIMPLVTSALVLIQLPASWQLIGIFIYTLISLLSLIIVWVSISGGHSLSRIQRWREANKYFLQFVAGAGLIILGFFVYVNEIVVYTVGRI